jgi:hypothetical protein
MLEYYPEVIRNILEFKAIIDSEHPEIEDINKAKDSALDDAYLLTMGEDRIKQWEKMLSITPLKDSTLQDRRDTILARIRGQGKLNSNLINTIVNTFTGGTAKSYVKDSILYVVVTPPPDNKQYRFENLEHELEMKVPAHLGFVVNRNYYDWEEVQNDKLTWQDLKNNFSDWEDVYLYVPF